jgi:Ca2+-binding RTX toxin-like protein
LIIFGTPQNDTITVEYGGAQGKAVVIMDNKDLGTFSFTGRIFVYGLGDNDTITIDPKITRTAFLYGGDGNDTIKSGGGNDILLGGAGNDVLDAGSGRDIMIGGLGGDTLNGGSGDDLMNGGSTIYDNNFKALDADLKEWSRTDLTYAQRAKDIQTGAGFAVSFPWNSSTVTSGATPVDFLNGGTGMDIFYYDPTPENGVKDIITHFKTGEIEVNVHG